MHKSRVLLYILLSYIFGVFVASFVSFSPIVSMSILFLGLTSLMINWRRNWLWALVGVMIIVFAVGGLHLTTLKLQNRVLSEFTDKNIVVTLRGYINSEPAASVRGQNFILRVKGLVVSSYIFTTDELVLVRADAYPALAFGDTLELTGKLQFPQNFDEFDYRSYLAKDGVFAIMEHPEWKNLPLSLPWPQRLSRALLMPILRFKNTFIGAIRQAVPEPNASFVAGILLGSRSNLPEDIKNEFSKTSLSHVLAISGYNITIIAEMLMLALVWLMRRQIAFWVIVGVLIVFTVLTGAQASVVRAAVMGILILLSRKEGRLYDVKNSLALAACAMLIVNPLLLRYDVGFQLSFAATLGIVFLSPIINRWCRWLPKKFKIREILTMTMSAQLAVLPMILYYFKTLSLVSLPANILVLPTIPYAMLFGFVTGVGGMISTPIGRFLGIFTWLVSELELCLVHFFSSLPGAAVSLEISLGSAISIYALLIFLIVRKRKIKDTVDV